jgi:hypothetical protein
MTLLHEAACKEYEGELFLGCDTRGLFRIDSRFNGVGMLLPAFEAAGQGPDTRNSPLPQQ